MAVWSPGVLSTPEAGARADGDGPLGLSASAVSKITKRKIRKQRTTKNNLNQIVSIKWQTGLLFCCRWLRRQRVRSGGDGQKLSEVSFTIKHPANRIHSSAFISLSRCRQIELTWPSCTQPFHERSEPCSSGLRDVLIQTLRVDSSGAAERS